MCVRRLLAAVAVVAICLCVTRSGRAADAVPMEVEQKLNTVQQAYAQLPLDQATKVAQVQYGQPVSNAQVQYGPPPPEQGPYFAPGTYVPPVTSEPPSVMLPPPPCEACNGTGQCCCDSNCYRSGWNFGFDIAALEPQVTHAEFGSFPDDAIAALRFTLGYEDCNGVGIRGILWGFEDEINAVSDDLDLEMGAFHLDIYKAIVSRHGELVLGAGPALGGLEFRLPGNGGRSEFDGGGGSVFGEAYYATVRRPRWELALVGQTRMSLLTGDWKDNTGSIVARTDNDSMSIFEISYGLEFRRRFGQCADHYWYVRLMNEYQRWSSDWMSNFIFSGVGLTGTNFSFGVTW